jgi:hypothetical protein
VVESIANKLGGLFVTRSAASGLQGERGPQFKAKEPCFKANLCVFQGEFKQGSLAGSEAENSATD